MNMQEWRGFGTWVYNSVSSLTNKDFTVKSLPLSSPYSWTLATALPTQLDRCYPAFYPYLCPGPQSPRVAGWPPPPPPVRPHQHRQGSTAQWPAGGSNMSDGDLKSSPPFRIPSLLARHACHIADLWRPALCPRHPVRIHQQCGEINSSASSLRHLKETPHMLNPPTCISRANRRSAASHSGPYTAFTLNRSNMAAT